MRFLPLLLCFAPGLLFAHKHEEVEKSEASTARVAAISFSQPLSWFTASSQEGAVQLQWSAAAAIGSGIEYVIQRSTDGEHFLTLATLPANGSRFMYLDNATNTENGLYYRICARKGAALQVVSEKVAVGVTPAQALKVTAEETLDGQQLQLNIFAQNGQTGALKILDGAGNTIRSEVVLLNDGYNRVMVPDYQDMPSGNYYLTLETPNGLSALKLER